MDKAKKEAIAIRVFAGAAMILAVVGCIVFFIVNAGGDFIQFILPVLLTVAVLIYGIYLEVKAGGSAKTLAGFSITYHIVALVAGAVGWVFSIVYVFVGALSGIGNSSSSSAVSSAATSSSAGTSGNTVGDMAGICYYVFCTLMILFTLVGVAKIIIEFLYMKDHAKYKAAFISLASITTALFLLAAIALLVEFSLVEKGSGVSSKLELLPEMYGLSFVFLFMAQDLSLLSSPEVNMNFADGVTPKQ